MNIGAPWPDPVEAERRVRVMQTKLHQFGMNTWRAGCSGSCTSGSEGGPGKPTSRKAGRAPRSDPYIHQIHQQSRGTLWGAAGARRTQVGSWDHRWA